MPPRRNPSPVFPPTEQDAFFGLIKERLCASKYLDFLKVIKEFQEKQETLGEKDMKTQYLKYVNLLLTNFSREERAMENDGKTLKDILANTDLNSEFLVTLLNTHLDHTNARGPYFNSSSLNAGAPPATYSGATKEDEEVLNRDYILPTFTRQFGQTKGKGKECDINTKNTQDLNDAENELLDKQVRFSRFSRLQGRVEDIVRNPQEFKSGSSKKAGDAKLEFPAVEVAVLAEILRKEKRGGTVNESKEEARNILESLHRSPVRNGNDLLKRLASHSQRLCQEEKDAKLGYRKTMQNSYFNSIMRNSETVKFLQYPSLHFESLLNENLDLAAGKSPSPTSFAGRGNDDVCKNIRYEGGLRMQFEATRWHLEGLRLISKFCNVGRIQTKIETFQRVFVSFFDLVLGEQSCSRAHTGDFTGVVLYGDEVLYAAIRLYHALLTRLNTAFLLAEVMVAETEFRNNTNEVGLPGTEGNDGQGYLSDSAAEAGGWTQVTMPSVEGNAEDKMKAFLNALERRASANKTRRDDYTQHHFEKDVMAAIGPGGNQVFTMLRILHRLRDTLRDLPIEQLDMFERYFEDMAACNNGAAEKYKAEISREGHDWLFKFQGVYSDTFQNDEWGSIGEKGDIARVKADIVEHGPVPERKGLKRTAATAARGRKRRKKLYTGR